MRTRRARPAPKPKPPSTGRRGLTSAATLLPLAIGLGSNFATPTGAAKPTPPGGPCQPANSALSIHCPLPFEAICEAHSIDNSCGPGGSTSSGKPSPPDQDAQNSAKNNFCAKGNPVDVSFNNFDALQAAATAAHVPFGSPTHLPSDRSPLVHLLSLPGAGSIGEGTVVRLAAFVMDAHYSNVQTGESVNCFTKGPEFNDVHVVLVEQNPSPQPPPNECPSVTAEISPHFRPATWTAENLTSLARTKQFRFTGQLFFDAAHEPCHGNVAPSPQRRSLFEIHPVYAIDVCKAATSCKVDDEASWMPLSDLLESGQG